MTGLNLSATSRTPAVKLDLKAKSLKIEGESYPEDVTAFYSPIMQAVHDYFNKGHDRLNVEIHLIYFNSSSARANRIVGCDGRSCDERCQHHD